jgi:catechol 2,3-dioxygenase-like lactoylglutathione lyase family enzyme
LPTKINHIAIQSENYAISGDFYQWAFGLRTLGNGEPRVAATVSDGYLGININPRTAGRPAKLDHFGVEVDDIQATCARIAERYPSVHWVKRPASRPFASTTTHDPGGNVFDLSQRNADNRNDIYAKQMPYTQRRVDHFGMRALHPKELATFYHDVLDLEVTQRAGDPNFYLSDGAVTIVLEQWDIEDFTGTGIVSPGMDHIGFRVEDLDAFKRDVETLAVNRPRLAPFPFGLSPESKVRLELAKRSCPLCAFHLADVDGVLLSAHG